MPRIELAQLLRPTTTPEQELLLEHFYNQFDNRSAANRQIVNVEPLYYQGVIGGTEFLVYAPNKLYICYNIFVSGPSIPALGSSVSFYDETDNVSYQINYMFPYYNTTIPQRENVPNSYELKNKIFSRLISSYTYICFNGYRITLI